MSRFQLFSMSLKCFFRSSSFVKGLKSQQEKMFYSRSSSQIISEALNFSEWKKLRILPVGRARQRKPMTSSMTELRCQVFLTSSSKMSSPAGLRTRTNSSRKRALRQRLAETYSLMEDLRSRLYLSIQQKRPSSMAMKTEPSGMRLMQRKANQSDSRISPQRLPMTYSGSSMSALASSCVMQGVLRQQRRLSSFQRYQGLTSQMKGTRKAVKKNMMVSSSTIPYFCSKTLVWAAPSAISVITAVVKKSPSAYLSMKLNWQFSPVLCCSKSTKRCTTWASTNLLKTMTPTRQQKMMTVAVVSAEIATWCTSALKRKQIATVITVSIRMKKSQERKRLRFFPASSRLMYSQLISPGSGHWLMTMPLPPCVKWRENSSGLTLAFRTASLSSSHSKLTMALQALRSSLAISLFSFSRSSWISWQSAFTPSFLALLSSLSRSTFASISSVSLSELSLMRSLSLLMCLRMSASSCSFAFFSLSQRRMLSSSPTRLMPTTVGLPGKTARSPKKRRMRSPMVSAAASSLSSFLGGMCSRRTEKVAQVVVLSLQYFQVLVKVSLTQISETSSVRQLVSRRISSTVVRSGPMLASRIMKEEQVTWAPLTVRAWPWTQKLSFSTTAKQMSITEQLRICSSRITIAYFRKMKQSGKPSPRNSSSFEFPQSGIGLLLICFRQQMHSCRSSSSSSTRPGLEACPCLAANSQSGLRMFISRYFSMSCSIISGSSLQAASSCTFLGSSRVYLCLGGNASSPQLPSTFSSPLGQTCRCLVDQFPTSISIVEGQIFGQEEFQYYDVIGSNLTYPDQSESGYQEITQPTQLTTSKWILSLIYSLVLKVWEICCGMNEIKIYQCIVEADGSLYRKRYWQLLFVIMLKPRPLNSFLSSPCWQELAREFDRREFSLEDCDSEFERAIWAASDLYMLLFSMLRSFQGFEGPFFVSGIWGIYFVLGRMTDLTGNPGKLSPFGIIWLDLLRLGHDNKAIIVDMLGLLPHPFVDGKRVFRHTNIPVGLIPWLIAMAILVRWMISGLVMLGSMLSIGVHGLGYEVGDKGSGSLPLPEQIKRHVPDGWLGSQDVVGLQTPHQFYEALIYIALEVHNIQL